MRRRASASGKWHVGMTFFDKEGQPVRGDGIEAVRRVDFSRRIAGGPVDHGFERFFGTACCPTTDWLYAFIENDRIPVPPTGPLDKSRLPKHPYANDCRAGLIAPDFPMEEVDLVFLKKSREFLEQHVRQSPNKPFFLFHSAQAVHLPSFAALDKLANQKLMQAIIVVPEKAIGASFHDEPLSRFGFWADWKVEPKWNLCDAPGSDNGGKVDSLKKFLESGDKVLVCTHATFRFAVETPSRLRQRHRKRPSCSFTPACVE